MQEVGPIRVEFSSSSIRLSDILFQTGPTRKDFKTFEFLDFVMRNDIPKSVTFARSQSEPNRKYFAWVLSNIVHERLHILQSYISPLGSFLARRQWALILNISPILTDFALRKKFFYRLNWNFDAFMCEHYDVPPSTNLLAVQKMLDNSNRYFDGNGRSKIFRTIQLSQASSSETPSEIEAKRKKFYSGYLPPVQVFELWAYLIQINFLKKNFPDDAETIIEESILPIIADTYADFRAFFEHESGIDIFATDERESNVVLTAIFFACSHEIGGILGDVNDAGTRLVMASRVLYGRGDISALEFIHLLEKILPYDNLADAISQNRQNDQKLLSTASAIIGNPNASQSHIKFVTEIANPLLKCHIRVKALVAGDFFSNQMFLECHALLKYLEESLRPPIVLECNSRMNDGGIESVYGDWSSGSATRLALSPVTVDFDDEYDHSEAYWTRLISTNQNTLDPSFFVGTDGDPLVDRFMSGVEPIANLLLEDFGCRALLTQDKRRLRALFSEYGEGVCESDWTSIEGRYLRKFVRYEMKCDLCGEDVDYSEGVFKVQNGYFRADIREDAPPLYIVPQGYDYVHKYCDQENLE